MTTTTWNRGWWLAAIWMCAAPSAYAEGPVGLEAQGVDTWAVLRAAPDLDARDALNRPVSRDLLVRELAAGEARARFEGARLGRLRWTNGLWQAVRELDLLASGLKPVRPGDHRPAAPDTAQVKKLKIPQRPFPAVLHAVLERHTPGLGDKAVALHPLPLLAILRC